MLIQVEVREDNTGLNYYCGEIEQKEFDEIISGTYPKDFIHLKSVFWPAKREAKKDYDETIEYVVKFGSGDRQNFTGDLYIRKKDIILISTLREVAHRDGRKLGDLSQEIYKRESVSD